MDRLIYLSMTGAKHTMGRQAAVAHNLANATSTGYRAEEHKLRAVPVLSEGLPTRAFVVDASVSNNFDPGSIQHTGRSLDLAVQGKGWIAVQMPDGSEAYTRNGSLEVSANGVLQTRSGLPVLGDGGPITIPPDNEITIGRDGSVSVVPSTGAKNTVAPVGRIKLVNPQEADLKRGEDGLFRMANGQPAEVDANVVLASGYLEGSNVNVVEEMVNMIGLARQFEMQLKMLQSEEANDQAGMQVLAHR